MKRILGLLAPVALVVSLPLAAQVSTGSDRSTSATQVKAPPVIQVQPSLRPVAPATPVRSDASQRPAAAPIQSQGPAQGLQTPAVEPKSSTQPTSPSVQALDRQGRPISGAVRVGSNRILDPTTGKVHTTMPMGSGEQVVD